jgi:hypothetical protein
MQGWKIVSHIKPALDRNAKEYTALAIVEAASMRGRIALGATSNNAIVSFKDSLCQNFFCLRVLGLFGPLLTCQNTIMKLLATAALLSTGGCGRAIAASSNSNAHSCIRHDSHVEQSSRMSRASEPLLASTIRRCVRRSAEKSSGYAAASSDDHPIGREMMAGTRVLFKSNWCSQMSQ